MEILNLLKKFKIYGVCDSIRSYKSLFKQFCLILLAIIFHVWIGIGIFKKGVEHLAGILILIIFVYWLIFYKFVFKNILDDIILPRIRLAVNYSKPFWNFNVLGCNLIGSVAILLSFLGFFAWIIIDSNGHSIRIHSFFGALALLFFGFIISANPAKIKWRPVIGGILLQIIMAFLVLRWRTGSYAFELFSNTIVGFLDYTNYGTRFVYGFGANPVNFCGLKPAFIYTGLQIIIYFGAIVSILYYYGIIQAILTKLSVVMHYTIGTTPVESLNAVACIFLGQTEAAILIEPALSSMTDSEIHTVMTAGFACISGALFAVYISFGACPIYLLSATVMSAAVSLSISKLLYPELEEIDKKKFQFALRNDQSLLECVTNGAYSSAKLVIAIAVNLLVYVAMLYLGNHILKCMGQLVGIQELTFNKILSYVFLPFTYIIGVSDAEDPNVFFDENLKVAELIGIKTFLNEFIAYKQLNEMIVKETLNGARAKMMAIYALCGFSNISMIGSTIGILSSMCPEKKNIFARLAVRALISGILSCFLTTCVAGMIIDVPMICHPSSNGNCINLGKIEQYLENVTRSQLS